MPAPRGNQNAKGNKGGGRKTSYHPEFATQARGIAELGATDAGVAKVFGVSISTIERWKRKHVEFKKALKQGKEAADSAVQASLFKRATGFTFKETKQEGIVDQKTGGITKSKITTTTKEVAPDTAAAFIWLKNRQPENWRDKQHVVHSGDIIPEIASRPSWLEESDSDKASDDG